MTSLDRLSKRLKELQENASPEDPAPILTFDKDDVDTLDFVTAAANLRATVFRIKNKSKFDTKGESTSPEAARRDKSLTKHRDGRQHHSRHCHNERDDRRSLCSPSLQGATE